jgi:hypothetical protein
VRRRYRYYEIDITDFQFAYPVADSYRVYRELLHNLSGYFAQSVLSLTVSVLIFDGKHGFAMGIITDETDVSDDTTAAGCLSLIDNRFRGYGFIGNLYHTNL